MTAQHEMATGSVLIGRFRGKWRRTVRGRSGGWARRPFPGLLTASALGAAALSTGVLCAQKETAMGQNSAQDATNVLQFEPLARRNLNSEAFHFLSGGADDLKTLHANYQAFDLFQIRARRLVDVSSIDTRIRLLGEELENPILLAPIGNLKLMHDEGELAVARASSTRRHRLIASTVSNFSIDEIAAAGRQPPWFQLYPTDNRTVTRRLLEKAETAGCPVVVLTVDSPVLGNRETQRGTLEKLMEADPDNLGNFRGITEDFYPVDPGLTWDFLEWMKKHTAMKLVIKGIVTREDARLCVENGADGLIVSNHGGRQEESNRSTMESLGEVVEAVEGKIPVLIDGGFRRGTDVFKALALGASAVCVGRPYVWGLASFGEEGVERVLELLHSELVRIMQLAGTPDVSAITPAFVERKILG